MRKIGWLSVLLSVLAYGLLAVVGHGLGYLYLKNGPQGGGGLRGVFELYVARPINPFAGGFLGDLRATFVLAWLVGLAVGVVVLALFVLLATRSGSAFGVFTGAWLGAILGTALAGVVSSLISISEFVRSDSRFDLQWNLQVFGSLEHGLYWGAVAGWIVALAAVLGGLGRGRRTTEPAPPPPDSSWQPQR